MAQVYTPRRVGTPKHKPAIPEGPILDFCTLIEDTPTEDWKRRIQSFHSLVSQIPRGSAYAEGGQSWYNTPTILRHLALAVSELLKDARSTVVKQACEQLTILFNKCQTDARYLFKDIMPTILSVHAQTVQVIRSAVQNMVVETIPEVPCKMVMPLWMERLKVDKSRTVREACALYLGQALQAWTETNYLTQEIWMQVGSTLVRSLRDPSPAVRSYAKAALERMRCQQAAYWETLINDPNGPAAKDPKVKRWLKAQGQQPSGDSVSVAEDLSVVSKFSYNSDTRFVAARNGGVTPSTPSYRMASPRRGFPTYPRATHMLGSDDDDFDEQRVPTSIAVTKSSSARNGGGGLGPPLRPRNESSSSSQGTPPRPPTLTVKTDNSPLLEPIADNSFSQTEEDPLTPRLESSPRFPADLMNTAGGFGHETTHKEVTPETDDNQEVVEPEIAPTVSSDEGAYDQKEEDEAHDKPPVVIVTSRSDDGSRNASKPAPIRSRNNAQNGTPPKKPETPTKKSPSEGPFIVSMQRLKEHAMKRRSRNSLLMQQRFRMSNSNVSSEHLEAESDEEDDEAQKKTTVAQKRSEEENVVPNADHPRTHAPPSPRTQTSSHQAPEHMVIAIRLLRAHKLHVDRIMETLKMEMDALRDFDRLLEEAGRPTEEETLDYFESVGLCLDQRGQASAQLQHELDRISRGEPPEEED